MTNSTNTKAGVIAVEHFLELCDRLDDMRVCVAVTAEHPHGAVSREIARC
jgi:hypothetical protein